MTEIVEVLETCPHCAGKGTREALPWDHPSVRNYEPVELLAEKLYERFDYDGPPGTTKPKWQSGGNGLKQDEARHKARKQLRKAGHKPILRAALSQPLPGEAETLKQIAAFNITPSTGASVAMAMRRIAEEALSQPTATEQIRREVMSDVEIAAWGRDWHWADTAENKPTDPSIYFRDTRMLKAFAAALAATEPPRREVIEALEAAQLAIEASMEMNGPDHAGLMLSAINKIDRALPKKPV